MNPEGPLWVRLAAKCLPTLSRRDCYRGGPSMNRRSFFAALPAAWLALKAKVRPPTPEPLPEVWAQSGWIPSPDTPIQWTGSTIHWPSNTTTTTTR